MNNERLSNLRRGENVELRKIHAQLAKLATNEDRTMEETVRERDLQSRESWLRTKDSFLGFLGLAKKTTKEAHRAVSSRISVVADEVNDQMKDWWREQQANKTKQEQANEAKWVAKIEQYEALKLKEAAGKDLEMGETATIRDLEVQFSVHEAQQFLKTSLARAQEQIANLSEAVGDSVQKQRAKAYKLAAVMTVASALAAACSGPDQNATQTPATSTETGPNVTQFVPTETPTEDAFVPTTAPTETPTEVPTEAPTATEVPLEDVEVGPNKFTGEQYKLLHTQNVTGFEKDADGKALKDENGMVKWTMISPEVYAAREEMILEVRQTTITTLAAELGIQAPENTLTNIEKWLWGLKNSGKIDDDKFWEYAGNMMITNEEIKALVQNQEPVNPNLKYAENTTPGLNYDESDKVVVVKLPDGTTVENRIPSSFQGKVLFITPVKLIPGEHEDMIGKGYLGLGDDNNNPITIAAMTTAANGNMMARDYHGHDNDVTKMPKKWLGYYFASYQGAANPIYYSAKNFYLWGEAIAGANQIKVTNLSIFENKWVRVVWIFTYGLPWYNVDSNGVMQPVNDTTTIAEKK